MWTDICVRAGALRAVSGVDTTPLEYTGERTNKEVAELEEKRVNQSIKAHAEKGLTPAQRKEIEERERKQREEDERKRQAAEKLERKRREGEARLAALKAAQPAPAEAPASADKLAAAADVLKFAVQEKLKAKEDKGKQKSGDE